MGRRSRSRRPRSGRRRPATCTRRLPWPPGTLVALRLRRSSTASTPCLATRPSFSPRTSSAGEGGLSTRSTACGSPARPGRPSRRPRRRRARGGRIWCLIRGRGRLFARTDSCCIMMRWRGLPTWRGRRAGRGEGAREEQEQARGGSLLRRPLGSSSLRRRSRGLKKKEFLFSFPLRFIVDYEPKSQQPFLFLNPFFLVRTQEWRER